MTKKAFKEAMKRGLGRCILELQKAEDPQRYREAVLWGCTHNLSYDTQCEGTRAWYMRELIRFFPDEEPFLEAVIRKLRKRRFRDRWEFCHYEELVSCFARGRNQRAMDALLETYRELYCFLERQTARKGEAELPEWENLETLCIDLVDSLPHPFAVYGRIAEDIGRLLQKSGHPSGWHFDWLFAHCEQRYGKERIRNMLEKKAAGSSAAACYLTGMQERAWETKSQKKRTAYPETTEALLRAFDWKEESVIRMSVWLKRSGNAEAARIFAERYINETDREKRIRLLELFRISPFPLPPEAVIKDAESGDERLCRAAMQTLYVTRHETVRRYARILAERGQNISDAAVLLAENYQPEDRELLVRLVKKIPVTYEDAENWHGVYSSVRRLLERKGVRNAPTELLFHMYENTLCSCCREYIVAEMGRRRQMTEQLWQECLWDSSQEIRARAGRRLAVRTRRSVGTEHRKR